MSETTETKDDHTVLRIPKKTRSDLKRIAENMLYPPKWTTLANQVLLDFIYKENKERPIPTPAPPEKIYE